MRSALPLGVAVLLAAGIAAAERVRCPVCGEEFENRDRPVCPNDGTNLVLEGRPVGAPAEGADAGVEEEKAEPGAPSIDAPPRYRRHDVGGERQRVDADQGEYTDRERRIGEERRGQAAAAQRRQRELEREQARFAAEDERLRDEFDERRLALAGERRPRADPWWSGPEHLRDAEISPWRRTAPLVALGARLLWMGEDGRAGALAGAEMDINPFRTRLRVGLSSFIGVRMLGERRELLFLEHVAVGVQMPWRWSPHLLARMGVGVLSGERSGRSTHRLALAAGFDAGIDCHVTDTVVITPVIGYGRYIADDTHWDSVTLKIGIGF